MAQSIRKMSTRVVAAAAVALLAVITISLGVALLADRRDGPSRPDPAQIEEYRRDAVQFFDHGQFDEARARVEKILERSPDDLNAHLLMAEVLTGLKQYEGAYDHARTAVEMDRDNEERQFFAGVLAARIERWEQAVGHHTRAAQLNPHAAKYPLHIATSLLRMNRLDEARAQALRAQRIDGSLAESYLLLAQIADARDELPAALDALNQGLGAISATNPKWLDCMVYKSQLLRRTGAPAEAANLLTGLTPRQQQEERIVAELSTCYLALDEIGKAAAVWAELFALDPRNARAAAEAGLCLARTGETSQARRYLSYARAIDPRHPTVEVLATALSPANAR